MRAAHGGAIKDRWERTSQRGGGAAAAFTHRDFYIELSHESLSEEDSIKKRVGKPLISRSIWVFGKGPDVCGLNRECMHVCAHMHEHVRTCYSHYGGFAVGPSACSVQRTSPGLHSHQNPSSATDKCSDPGQVAHFL